MASPRATRTLGDGLDHGTSGYTRSYGTRSDTPLPPPPSYSAPAPSAPPVVVQQSGGNNGLLLGYMLGRSSQPRETVVVQQPTARATDSSDAGYRHVSSDNATPDADTAASDAQAAAVDPSSATTAKPPKKENKHWVLGGVVLIGGFLLAGWLVFKLLAWVRRAWSDRKARYVSRTNYRL